MSPNSPLRHGNQQGSLSPKDRAARPALRGRRGAALRRAHGARVRGPRARLPGVGRGEGPDARGAEATRTSSPTRASSSRCARSDGRPYSAGFQANRFSALKSFFGFLTRRLLVLARPDGGARAAAARDAAAADDPHAARGAAGSSRRPARETPLALRDRAILETLYATGIRASELIQLSPFDVDTEERTLRVVRGKGGKDRNVPLTPPAAAAIESYLANGRPQLLAATRERAPASTRRRPRSGSSSRRAAVSSTARRSTRSSAAGRSRPASRSASRRTPSATAWRRTSSSTAPTSATSRRSSATRASPRPSATRTSRSRTCRPW